MATEQGESSTYDETWERPVAFYNEYVKWAIYGGTVLFVVWSVVSLLDGVTLQRVIDGTGHGVAFLEAMYPPETGSAEVDRVVDMMVESVAMAMVATLVGVAISVPIAFGAAENLVPRPVYWLNRGLIMFSRAIDGLIVAIIAVKAVGLGPLAGIIAISFKTVGFFSKLLAEDIEDIDHGSLEAIEATGASRLQGWIYGVAPQIIPRFVGLTVYRWDINIRASTIIGIVGAGGIGTLLMQAFDRFQYDYVATILIAITAVVLLGEIFSAYVRRRVQ